MIKTIKKLLSKNPLVLYITKKIYFFLTHNARFQSSQYWRLRYKKWWNSGAGSYGRLAEYKWSIISDFVKNNNIKSVIEFGCGDGNNLKYYKIPHYIWLDISEYALSLCQKQFSWDKQKSFFLYHPYVFCDNHSIFSAECTFSLDVIYHLIEDDIYEKYMFDLFSASQWFVIIYSSNTDINSEVQGQHVKHRNFVEWIANKFPHWHLIEKIPNKYTLQYDEERESFSDFYIFKK